MRRKLKVESNYYRILKSEIRREIITVLGEKGRLGFKELKNLLKVSVGTLYYHLDMLSDYISQDIDKKYYLNDNGKTLYRTLKEGYIHPEVETKKAISSGVLRAFLFTPLFSKVISHSALFSMLAVLLLGLGAYNFAYFNLELFLLIPMASTKTAFEIFVLTSVQWIFLVLFIDAFTTLIFKRAHSHKELFACVIFASIPIFFLPFFSVFFKAYWNLALVLIYSWHFLLLSAAITYAKGLRYDKSVIVSLSLYYINFSMLILLGKTL